MPSVTLSNGIVISGSDSQIRELQQTIAKLGGKEFVPDPYRYYNSETRGYILISEMDTTHLRNAILKYYKDWVIGLHSITNPQEVCKMIVDGITDRTWLAMVREYSRRDNPR